MNPKFLAVGPHFINLARLEYIWLSREDGGAVVLQFAGTRLSLYGEDAEAVRTFLANQADNGAVVKASGLRRVV